MTRSRHLAISFIILGVVLVPLSATAEVSVCRKAITKATQQFVAAKSKALQRCEDKKIGGGLPQSTACRTESGTAFAIGKASAKARAAIVKGCCGADRICGNAGDDPLSSIGWSDTTQCPNFENGATGSCANAINDPGDVADCTLCVASGATDQLIELLYGSRTSTTDTDLLRCQRAVGKATIAYLRAKTRAVEKCWEKRIAEAHGNDCPTPGDGKATAAIAKAAQKMTAAVCKACGGNDGACDGVSDYSAAAIGFPTMCPDVAVPKGGPACGGPVVTLADLVSCADCVADFKADCVDDLAARQYESYECGGVAPTPTPTNTPLPTGPTVTPTPTVSPTPNANCGNCMLDAGEACDPTAPAAGQACDPSVCVPPGLPAGAGAEFACTCAAGSERTSYAEGQLDNGWTGTSQGTKTVEPINIDLLLFDCDGTSDPACQLYGPRGGPYDFRCELNPRITCDPFQCNPNADCGANGRCGQFLGAPLPLASGNVPVCVTTFFDQPVNGTLNVATGATDTNSLLKAIVFLGSAVNAPCATCDALIEQVGQTGTCSAGGDPAAIGQPCVIQGLTGFGPTSLDCPPLASSNISGSGLDIRFLPTTTGQSVLDLNGVPCTDPAAAGFECPCDTCGGGPTPNAPCNSDAQCGAGGICGARRCVQGSNLNQICASDAECPPSAPGSCGRPGLATKPNGCESGCDGGANNNQPCANAGDCPSGTCVPLCRQRAGDEIGQGECLVGPTRGHCSVEDFRGCANDLECNPPPLGSCLTCQLGQTCNFDNLPCHVYPIQLQGEAGAFSLGSSTGQSVNSFCIPPTTSTAVNQTAGLPGEGVILVPHTLTVQFPAAPQ